MNPSLNVMAQSFFPLAREDSPRSDFQEAVLCTVLGIASFEPLFFRVALSMPFFTEPNLLGGVPCEQLIVWKTMSAY